MQKLGETDVRMEGVQETLGQIGTADAVLGLPTNNNRATVGRTAEACLRASEGRLSGYRIAVVNADGGSRDGTSEYLRELLAEKLPLLQISYPLYPVNRLAVPLAGVPGRTAAAIEIFRCARQLDAKVCALLDVEVESIGPEWIDRLTRPVLDGTVDLTVPSYRRRKFDGLINSGILSPFARTLFGKRLRQPAGADLGFSADLMDRYLAQTASSAQMPPHMDPWSPVSAIVQGFRVGQTSLGPRVARPREAPLDVSGTLRLVLAGLFDQMEFSAAFWQKVRGWDDVPWFGPPLEIDDAPSDLDRNPMIDSFRQGCKDLMEIWSLVLPPQTLLDLRRIERQPDGSVRFADDLWARIIYDFALAYHLRSIGRDHLLQAITPLYLGWAASLIGETENASGVDVEERFERLSTQFDLQKKYLISRWRWPDRFSP